MPKPPAFAELKPSLPVYYALGDREQMIVEDLLRGSFEQIDRMDTAHIFPQGFYRVYDVSHLFVKILNESAYYSEQFAIELERELYDKGIRTRKGQVILFKGYVVVMYPYQHFHYSSNEVGQLDTLGALLKEVHLALSDFSMADEVQKNWSQRLESFLLSVDFMPEKVRDQFRLYQSLLIGLFKQQSQVIHGDLNFGNVLFEKDKPMIIDYENSCYTWLPVEFDVAMVVERFCLNGNNQTLAEELLVAFLQSYDVQPFNLADMMICVSLRSLLVLAEIESQDREVSKSEWDKFTQLIDQAEASRVWLNKVTRERVWES